MEITVVFYSNDIAAAWHSGFVPDAHFSAHARRRKRPDRNPDAQKNGEPP